MAEWRDEIRNGNPSPERAAQLHIWLGEAQLASEEPDKAEPSFLTALKLVPKTSPGFGLSAYDLAVTRFYQGRFGDAAHAFRSLLKSRAEGYNRRNAAMFARHAAACDGYHKGHLALGIAQPDRLDPLCGVAAMAVSMRYLGLPYEKASMKRLVPWHGMGSSLDDLRLAAKRMGTVAHAVQADDQGLIALPKPLVAHVERDHFVSVVSADKKGVTYFCSDCGPWPGGPVKLNWKQWHAMEADAYLSVVKPGSVVDRALTALEQGKHARTLGALASLHNVQAGPARALAAVRNLVAALENHVVTWLPIPLANIVCGQRPDSAHCPTCAHMCPVAKSGGSGRQSAPTQGGPVNLATGEEEYTPDPDITVYNPSGPSISWSRTYNSLGIYTSGFGSGWSHPYNVGVEVNDGAVATPGSDSFSTGNEQTAGTQQTTFGGNIVFANGAKVHFSGTKPTATTPHVNYSLGAGYPYLLSGDYDSTSGTYTFTVTLQDRTKWTTLPYSSGFPTGPTSTLQPTPATQFLPVATLADCVGSTIKFKYGTYTTYNNGYYGSIKRLTEIDDANNVALLAIGMTSDGYVTSVSDRYGRSVYYSIGTYTTTNVPSDWQTSYRLVNQVSQIVPTGTANPPVRYQMGYSNYSNQEGAELVPYLHTVSVPSPTGSGMATMTINYNSMGYVDTVVDANGNVTQYVDTSSTAGTNETTVKVKNPQGTVVFQYAVRYDGNMNETARINGAGQTVYTRTFGSGSTPFRPSSVTDGNNRTWNYSWDQFNHLTSKTSPKGTVTNWTYSYTNFALGELTSVKEGAKTAISYTYYQPSGLVHEVITPIPGQSGTGSTQTKTYSYDALGCLTQIVSPGNNATASHVTSFGYTTDGAYSQSENREKPITITDSAGKVTHLRYDGRGNTTSITDSLGNQTQFTYNLADQRVTTTLPATGQTGSGNSSQTNSYLYTGGPLVQVDTRNEAGVVVRSVTYGYGSEAEVLSRGGSTDVTSLTYDAAYRTKTVRDGGNNATTYAYDVAGRMTQITYPGASGSGTTDKVQFTSYDPVGNLLSRTDGNGQVTNFAYTDADGRLSSVAYPGKTQFNETFGYDAFDRVVSLTDGTGAGTIAYDDEDNVTSSTRTYTGLPQQTVSYTYWPDGARHTMVNAGGTWTYTYDAVGRYASLVSPAGTSSATYLDNGWQSSRTLPNGTATTYSYNAMGMPTALVNQTSGGVTLSQFGSFAYDGTTSITGVSASVPSVPAQGGTTSYTYDSQNRLTQETSTRVGGYGATFGYDASGNPTTFKGIAQAFNADNQQTSNGTFVYDGNGNPTTYKGTSFAFDPENRATGIGATWTAGYRADGLRGWKQSGSTRTYYLYDEGLPVLELTGTGSVSAINVYAPDGLVARQQGGNWIQYAFDHQGNVSLRLNSTQGILSSSVYDAFGAESSSTTPSDPFGYNARWGYCLDRETGLYLGQHRYYDPGTGRWVTRDPIGYAGGLDLYSYCEDSPILSADTSGFQSVPRFPNNPIRRFPRRGGSFPDYSDPDAEGRPHSTIGQDEKQGYPKSRTFPNGDEIPSSEREWSDHGSPGYPPHTVPHRHDYPDPDDCGDRTQGDPDISPQPGDIPQLPDTRPFWRADNPWAWGAGIGIGIGVLVGCSLAPEACAAAGGVLLRGGLRGVAYAF